MNERQATAKRPKLAAAALAGVLVVTAIAVILDSDSPLVCIPLIIVALCCTILAVQLLIGDMRWLKFIWIGLGLPLLAAAGNEWYYVVLIIGGAHLGALVIQRAVGEFEPIVRQPNQ